MLKRIFVFLSLIFLSFMVIFYGYRFIHYYKIEHDNNKVILLSETIKTKSKKLSLIDDNYYFTGKEVNNYIMYYGMLYRIISFNEESITLILNESITKLKYGMTSSYDKSDIKKWIDEEYTSIVKDDNLISVNILDKNTYSLMGGTDSFIFKDNMWIIDNDEGLVLSNNGEINKPYIYNYFLSIRPVIEISNRDYISGNGSKNNPYITQNKEYNTLKDIYVGQYIKYKDNLYRVISINNNVKVVSVESIGNHIFSTSTSKYKNISKDDLFYYLNNKYIEKLNKDDLVINKWNIGEYNLSYINTKKSTVSSYIGLLSIGDMFISDIIGYTLSNSTDYVYTIDDKKDLYLSSYKKSLPIYPSFVLNSDLKVNSGDGSKSFPFEVGE